MSTSVSKHNRFLALALGAMSITLLSGCTEQTADPRLILIGIDGGTWNLIDPLLAAGELPQLAALAERGVTADLEVTVEPLISPAIWTSIATGRSPAAHGITSFTADRRAIRVPTIWERLAAAGLRVGLYDYLITWPPRDLPGGFVVPGWLRRDATTSPRDLFARTGIPDYAYEVVDIGTLDDVVASSERELVEKPRTWNRLAEALQPQVGAVVFFAADVMSHRFYHTVIDEGAVPPVAMDPRFDNVIPETLRGIDRAVGEIVADLDSDDHVVVISDHGFQAIPEVVRNWGFDRSWLLDKAGVNSSRDGVSVINSFTHLSLQIELGPEDERETVLRRLEAFFSAIRGPDGEEIFRAEIVREPGKAAEAAYPDWMKAVIADRMPAYAFVFVLPVAETLDRLWPDGQIEIGSDRYPLNAFSALHVFSGDHHPTGMFLAAGGAIQPRMDRTRLSVLDVAPLLFYLARQPIPDDLEGMLDDTLIRPQHLKRYPPQEVAADAAPRLPEEPTTEIVGGKSDEELARQLRALSYIG